MPNTRRKTLETDGHHNAAPRASDEKFAAQFGNGHLIIIRRDGAADAGQLLGAPDTSEVDVRVIGLPRVVEPMEPIVAPLARVPELCWKLGTTVLRVATAITIVAIEIATRVPRKLCSAAACEGTLPSPRDLQVKAVIAGDIVTYVRDLDDHPLTDQLLVRAAPVAVAVHPIHKLQLEALAAIGIAGEAVAAGHCCSGKAHA